MSENVVVQASQPRSVTAALALILALACGFIAANLYYAQPLTALIGGEFQSIALLVLAAVLIDAGLVINFVLSQRAIYGPKPASRSRIGGLFTAMFFTGGALGSALAAATLVAGGWQLTCATGVAFATAALALYASEFVRSQA